MPTHLLALDDNVLARILQSVVSADPGGLADILLICKHFRDVLLAAATSASITCNNDSTLLQHSRSLRSMTLAGCSRLPWAVDVHDGIPCCAPQHLSHLSSITRIDASQAALSDVAEMGKLRYLPELGSLHVSSDMPDSGLMQLLRVTSLRDLDLSGSEALTAACLPHLALFTFLDSLTLPGCNPHASECLPRMTGLTTLTRLSCACAWVPRGRKITRPGFSCLAFLTALRSLDLQRAVAKEGDGLCQLSTLRHLEVLDLSHNGSLAHRNLAFLSCLPHLRTLELFDEYHDSVDMNECLAHMTGLTGLRDLSFNFHDWTDEGLARLACLPAVQITSLYLKPVDLYLEAANITEAGFACLHSMTSLRALTFCFYRKNKNEDQDDGEENRSQIAAVVPHLMGLESLHEVFMEFGMSDEALAHLCKLSSLKRLALDWNGSCSATMRCLPYIAKFPALEDLDLRRHWCLPMTWDWNHAFMHVSALTTLTELHLGRTRVAQLTDEGLAHLSALCKLRSLELQDACLLTDRALASLEGWTCLTLLSLCGCPGISKLTLASRSRASLRHIDLECCPAINDDALASLSSLQALEALRVAACPQVTDGGLAHLQSLTTLTELRLEGCKLVTGKGLAWLSQLCALKDLQLSYCDLLEGRDIGALSCLRALTSVDLDGCVRVSDEALLHLARLPRLKELFLRQVPLTSDGLVHLAGNSTLRKFDLRDCPCINDESMVFLARIASLKFLCIGESITAAGRTHLEGNRVRILVG